MAMELVGSVTAPYPAYLIWVNRAWKAVQKKYLWSFLWGDAAISTPVPISAGTVTLTRGLNTVVGDATAAAAWLAIPLINAITTQQFRVAQGTIYNIIAFDGVNTITLDKLYVDPPSGAGQGYQIAAYYFNAPTIDFIWWESVVDSVTGYPLSTTMTRQESNDIDPQRFAMDFPRAVIPYQINPQPGNFLGFPMYEMWPAPLSGLTYIGKYYRSGTGFVNPTDTVAPPLDEDIVIERAKIEMYEWAIANPDKCPRGAGYQYLHGESQKKFKSLMDDYISKDEEFSKRNTIAYAEQSSILRLPWVSQRQSLGVFPD